MRELRELQLEDNGVTQLGEGAFSDLPKLKKLALSSNFLQELLTNSFKEVMELEHLYLDRNNISRWDIAEVALYNVLLKFQLIVFFVSSIFHRELGHWLLIEVQTEAWHVYFSF